MKQMYKVFLNDRLIKIGASDNITFYNTPFVFEKTCTQEEIRDWFQSFLNRKSEEETLLHPDPAFFFRLFRRIFIPVDAAGGVVVSGDRLLFIFRKGKWDLPKGKMKPGEQPEEAALREVEEETGIGGHRIVRKLPDTFHIYAVPGSEERGQWILKQTYWFEMDYSGELTGVPQQEEGITQVKWLQKNHLEEVVSNTYENLKQIIRLYGG